MRDNVNHETSFDVLAHSDLSNAMSSPLGDRIKKARTGAKLTQTKLGELVDVVQTTVQGWEDGRNEPKVDMLNKVADKTGVERQWLIGGESKLKRASTDEDHPQQALADTTSGRVTVERGRKPPKIRDLPILGYVKAGEVGFFLDQGSVGGYAMRPSDLEGIPQAYAVRVYDDSMKGKLDRDWVLQVDPFRRPKAGDFVIIQLSDGQCFVKSLVRRTERIITCEQFNPPKVVEYKANKVEAVHLVVGIDLISR